jgi:hypothetical protein
MLTVLSAANGVGSKVTVRGDCHALLVALGMPPRRAVALAGDDALAASPVCVARLSDLVDGAPPDAAWATVVVVASSYAQLRRDTVALDLAGDARRVIVHVADRRPSWWQLTAPAGVDAFDMRPESHGGTRAEASASRSMPVRAVATAVASARRHSPLRPGSGLRMAVTSPRTWEWSVEEPTAHLLERAADAWDDRASLTPPYDVLVHRRPAAFGPAVSGFDRPVLDTAVVNPAGFRRQPPDGSSRLAVEDGSLVLAGEHGVLRLDRDMLLTTAAAGRLRRLDHVDLRGVRDRLSVADAPPRLLARLFTVLAGLGVPTLAGGLPGGVCALLHPDLVRELEAVTPAALTSAAGRESVSVRQRRAALRTHSSSAGWHQIRADLGLPRLDPTVSVVAASRRPEFLPHLLRTVAAQRNVRSELIVVTHGYVAEPRVSALAGENVSLVRGPDHAPLGQLLAMGSSRATGDVIAKMDDDDWYGPHHLEDLLQAMAWSGAVLAGAPNEYVYLSDTDVTVTRPRPSSPDTAARYLAGPTLMIRRDDLRALGGWRAQPASVDLALVRAAQESGAMVTRIHGLGFVLCRHAGPHTWRAAPDEFVIDAAAVAPGFVAPPELYAGPDAEAHRADVRVGQMERLQLN